MIEASTDEQATPQAKQTDVPNGAVRRVKAHRSLQQVLLVVVLFSIAFPALISGFILIRENYNRTISIDSQLKAERYIELLQAGMRLPLWNISHTLGEPVLDAIKVDKSVISILVTTSTGTDRQYVSRNLIPGRTYTFQVRVELEQDGETLQREQVVRLGAGNSTSLAISFEEDSQEKAVAETDGCTTFGVLPEAAASGKTWLGQNWDWLAGIHGRTLVLRIPMTVRELLISREPEKYFLDGTYVSHPYVLVRLERVSAAALAPLLDEAHRYASQALSLRRHARARRLSNALTARIIENAPLTPRT